MGPVAYISLCLLGCLIFNPSLAASPGRAPSPRPICALRAGTGARGCPHGWLHYEDHCYGLFTDQTTWSDAEVTCQFTCTRAHLASILTATEGATVARYISQLGYNKNVWIGLHDPRHETCDQNNNVQDAVSRPKTPGMAHFALRQPMHSYTVRNGRWKWTDGALYRYKSWNPGEPNNRGGCEYCTELLHYKGFHRWNDIPCDRHMAFVCKYEL